MNRYSHILAVSLFLALAPVVRAEVVESSANTMKIKQVRTVAAGPEKAWKAFLEVNHWWSGDHTFSGDSANLHLDARAGGCWCETLPNGGSVLHLTVVYVAPNTRMTLSGGLGPLQTAGVAGALTFQIVPKGDGAEISILYTVGGYYPGGLTAVAAAVDGVLGGQLDRLQRLIETGSAEPKPPAK
jgi:uncharacterized protein YndB with AHSA1/START domain